jgi:beta-glucosidase/6-phospho-beta-glucosidase/beta-galactosidase
MNTHWAYFDRVSQGTPFKERVGGILYLSQNHNIKFKTRISKESNYFYELMALKLVLKQA